MTSVERTLLTVKTHLPSCCGPVALPDAPDAPSLAKAFRALGDETRLSIVRLLSRAPEVCVCHIGEGFSLGQPTISHHLKVLREAGLVDFHKRGLWAYYYLRDDLPAPVRAAIAELERGSFNDYRAVE